MAGIIVQVSARFVKEHCSISFILPFILFVMMLVFEAIWIIEALGYYSMGEPTFQEKQLPFQHFEITTFVQFMRILHIFQLFWVVWFFIETKDFLVAGAATSWYFKRDNPYSESKHRYRYFHFGSIAMGSFLRFFLSLYFQFKFIKDLFLEDDENEGLWKKYCSLCYCIFCTHLINCFNGGAYALIHWEGDGYYTSAQEVLALKLRYSQSARIMILMNLVTIK